MMIRIKPATWVTALLMMLTTTGSFAQVIPAFPKPARRQFEIYHKKDPGPNDPASYIPYEPAYNPIKRVRIIIHVFGKDDGSGNIPENTEGREHINRIVNHCNWYYADIEKPRPASPDSAFVHIHDSRLRFVLDTVYFHRNTDAWDFGKYTLRTSRDSKDTFLDDGLTYKRGEELYAQYITGDSGMSARRKDSCLHVFFLENGKYTGKGMADQLYTNRWVYLAGAYALYIKEPGKPNHWSSGELLAHELGHAMGLHHPFDYSGIADLPNTPRGASNNIMDYWPNQGRALTPLQMGMLQIGLAGRKGSVFKTVIPDWQIYRPDSTIYIPAGDTVKWTGDKFFCCDVVVEPGAVLLLKAKLTLPAGAQVRVRKNGALIIDGGEITTDREQPWAGVRLVKPNRFLFFKGRSLSRLELKNGGKLEKAATPVKEVKF